MSSYWWGYGRCHQRPCQQWTLLTLAPWVTYRLPTARAPGVPWFTTTILSDPHMASPSSGWLPQQALVVSVFCKWHWRRRNSLLIWSKGTLIHCWIFCRATAKLGHELLFKDTTVLQLCEEGGKVIYVHNTLCLKSCLVPEMQCVLLCSWAFSNTQTSTGDSTWGWCCSQRWLWSLWSAPGISMVLCSESYCKLC